MSRPLNQTAAAVTPLRPVPPPPSARPPSVPDRATKTPYWVATPLESLRALADAERELLRLTGRPLSWVAAVADYLVETDRGDEQFGLEDRAARWGWAVSKATMSRRMTRIREDADDRRGTYRAQRRQTAQHFGAPSPEEPTPDETPVQPDETATQPDETKSGTTGQKTQVGETATQPDETVVQRRETPSPHIPRARQTSDPDPEGLEAEARAREVLAGLRFPDPAIEAEVLAVLSGDDGALSETELVRAALCLNLTGVVPHQIRPVLDGLDPPARVALLVVVLRTGDTPRTSPRTNYLLTLARSLEDHDRQTRFLSARDQTGDADGAPGGAAQRHARGTRDQRTARERANQLTHADLEGSALDSLALLRARAPGRDPGGAEPPGGGR